MKKALFSILVFLSLVFTAHAEGERFDEFKIIAARTSLESDSVKIFLEQWAKDEPNNAEQIYCQGLWHYLLARPQIEYIDDLKEFEKSAMLPACTRFENLQINCFYIMKDKGNGMEHYLKAHEYYKKAIEKQPNNLELYVNLNEFYMWKYETKYATSLALDLLDMHQANNTRWTDFYDHPFENPDQMVEEHMNQVVGDLVRKGDISLASILCDSLVSRYPNSKIYQFDKGVILLNSYKQEEAIEHFLKMSVDFPNDGNVTHALASLYSQAGDKENARKYATILAQSKETQWAMAGQQLLEGMEEFVIDFEDIRLWMHDHTDEYLALEQRFIEGDASLTMKELSRIYFGHALTDKCKSVALTNVNLGELLATQKYEELLKECRTILDQHPASIAGLVYALQAASNLENEAGCLENLYLRLNQIVSMINKDAEDSLKQDPDMPKSYKILWRADEDIFVELLPEEERGKTSFFSNPGYFIEKQ